MKTKKLNVKHRNPPRKPEAERPVQISVNVKKDVLSHMDDKPESRAKLIDKAYRKVYMDGGE